MFTHKTTFTAPRRNRGMSLIEILVGVVIGLLGMFGMQSRASVVEMEAYQRAQALALLKDMESRIRTNRAQFDAAFAAGASAHRTSRRERTERR